MIQILNVTVMFATIVFGLIGWVMPEYTMRKLGLSLTEGRRLGLSEVRAVNGCLFVVIGIAALVINAPLAYAMVGFMYAGAALGRATSIVVDRSGELLSYSFVGAEAVFAAWLIIANTAR